jgi:ribonuclease P protein component
MNGYESLKSNMNFQNVYKNGRSYANKYLVMYVLENRTDNLRVGISVSKKVGNSIVRHRLTRLIRESVRLNSDKVLKGYDLVIIARVNLKDKKYAETESAFLHLTRLHGINI